MGCDIHHTIERRIDYKSTDGEVYRHEWLSAGELDFGRNYELFAVLADVRNYTDAPPVAQPKGMPGWKGYNDKHGWHSWDGHDEPSRAFREYFERWYGDAHSATWLTLAELKAYDIDQEIEDDSVVVGRRADKVTATAQWAAGGPHEVVGRRKVLRWPGEDEPTVWLSLLAAMERAKWDDQDDEGVRLVCFFDN